MAVDALTVGMTRGPKGTQRASEGSRTLNPRITNAVLCRLKLRWQASISKCVARIVACQLKVRCDIDKLGESRVKGVVIRR